MKQLFPILALTAISIAVSAQVPQSLNYQAVIRTSDNQLLKNTTIGMQVNILTDPSHYIPVYSETHSPVTNSYGLVAVEIGSGTVQTGDFSEIDWANGPYFLQIQIDPEGGINYSNSGTTQLLSVPYALHAGKADDLHIHAESGESSLTVSDSVSSENGLRIGLDGTGDGFILNTTPGEGLELGTGGDADMTFDREGHVTFQNEVRQAKVGTAHLLPVAYGLVYGDGSRNDIYSTNNFTSSRISTGRYKIDVHGFNRYPFIPFANAYGSSAADVIVSIRFISSDGNFEVYCYDVSSQSAVDIIFMFVAYRP